MFQCQHIFESTLVRNQPIQLSNDVTVTLFLNQSSQNFEVSSDACPSGAAPTNSRPPSWDAKALGWGQIFGANPRRMRAGGWLWMQLIAAL